MNYEKAIEIIKGIFRENKNENVCVYIDGQWGIGKTYTLYKFREDNSDIDIKYLSVFGKSSLEIIERDIVLQLLGIDKIEKIWDKNEKSRIVANILSEVINSKIGITSDLIKNISIDHFKGNKKTIICIDDLERKSEGINLRDMLGFVERITNKFDVILIGNINRLSQDELEQFNEFKEKIIDYEIKVDELSEETLISIAKNRFSDLDKDIIYVIKEVFLAKRLNKDPILNLRIYKKYINLLNKIECIVIDINSNLHIDKHLIKIANNIIYDNYVSNNNKYFTNGYMYKELFEQIGKIFRNEEYSKDVFKEYLEEKSEIKEDIKKNL